MRRLVGSFQSGQMGQTVNLLAQPSKVRILHSPSGGVCDTTPLFYSVPVENEALQVALRNNNGIW